MSILGLTEVTGHTLVYFCQIVHIVLGLVLGMTNGLPVSWVGSGQAGVGCPSRKLPHASQTIFSATRAQSGASPDSRAQMHRILVRHSGHPKPAENIR